MKKIYILFLFTTLFYTSVNSQETLIKKIMIDIHGKDFDPKAYDHPHELSDWKRYSDKFLAIPILYRYTLCTTVANKKTGAVAHPVARFEVKLSSADTSFLGFLHIVGTYSNLNENYQSPNKYDTTSIILSLDQEAPFLELENSINYNSVKEIFFESFDRANQRAVANKLQNDTTNTNKKPLNIKKVVPTIGRRG